MKLSKEQVNALANQIAAKGNEPLLKKQEEETAKLQKEQDKIVSILKKEISKLSELFVQYSDGRFGSYLKNEDYLKSFARNSVNCKLPKIKLSNIQEIIDAIHVASIDAKDMAELKKILKF